MLSYFCRNLSIICIFVDDTLVVLWNMDKKFALKARNATKHGRYWIAGTAVVCYTDAVIGGVTPKIAAMKKGSKKEKKR